MRIDFDNERLIGTFQGETKAKRVSADIRLVKDGIILFCGQENKRNGIFLWGWFTFITLWGHSTSTPMINNVVEALKETK
jgi:hypothetical protein